MSKCDKQVPNSDLVCGQRHGVYCSDECAKAVGLAELAELGITPDMMKDALAGYYECKDMIVQRERDGTRQEVILPDPPLPIPYATEPE